jgi:hypothetical protein
MKAGMRTGYTSPAVTTIPYRLPDKMSDRAKAPGGEIQGFCSRRSDVNRLKEDPPHTSKSVKRQPDMRLPVCYRLQPFQT